MCLVYSGKMLVSLQVMIRLQGVPFVISLSDAAVRRIPEDAASLCDKAAVLGGMIIIISTSYKHVRLSNCL